MRGIVRVAALAGLLTAGCSVGTPAPYQATADTCFAFSVRALQRHVTVTTAPRACAGLSHAQVNLAITGAIRDVVGPRHKAVARRLAYQESAYLAHLISTVPPPGPVPLAVAPAGRPGGSALSLVALAAWIVTGAAGSYLLGGWLADGNPRRASPRRASPRRPSPRRPSPRRPSPRRRAQGTGMPPVIIASHFTLAVAGLAIWIAFVAADVSVLAWIAVGVVLLAAGLGMAILVTALPEFAASAWSASPGPPSATRMAQAAAPARAQLPATVIALHGVLATATILLVLLAAIGAA